MQKGQIFVLALIVLGLILTMTLVIISGAMNFWVNSRYSLQSAQAINLAEAGLDKAITSLNAQGGAYFGQGETFFGPGSFEITVTTLANGSKNVESWGFVPSKAQPKSKKQVKATVSRGLGAAFYYGIQVGEGGLIMSENSQVTGVGSNVGSVYSNGNIIMQNNSGITGDVYVAGGIQPTANQQSACSSVCSDFIFGTNVSGQDILDTAQSFKPTLSSVLNKVKLRLKKYGSPPDLVVRILADSSGKPDKNNILSSGTLLASTVTGTYGLAEVVFTSPPFLNADTTYWILLDTSSSSTNYWAWSADSLQGYTRGLASWTSHWLAANATWTQVNFDLDFETYMGGVPTYINGSNGVNIGGDAHANTLRNLNIGGGAYYQIAEDINASSTYPGSSDPVAQPMPLSESNISQWKNTASSSAVYSGDITTCPSTLAAGKYVGSISLPLGCTVTVGSPIWITGNLALSNNNTLRLDPAYGDSSGVVMVDNFITLENGNRLLGSGTPGSYLIVLSEFNSRDDPEGRDAISLNNSDNSGIIYTNLGSIMVANNNNMTEITAWKLKLMNNVVVRYDQGLANSFFSSGPSGAYSLIKGTYQIR
ncbi:MAG: hypothetical protein UU73_C0003G0197 [Candidatus Daviesbacteria bacterium GW2011_GWA1_41_61]|uniref:Type 4 fimbrial biogenesis protein PilX N-terminal domain-containing protein n=1 Tax=Candidatus Daviesbacteria bacterium GW2011_GWA2_40_9 TaxID=1618424 RepID=A0A0G0U450_9BACT|nr:MAG: hypothetical protein UU26_C0003G0029 [Candidatus Daviesbacteria bacterium GW2011_GWC1_40_9]KKR83844.1 MAG: hypothetical protein UU29_C0001G0064 [Candidatus Daviesbacteria bacterium GW2011_GWA2_40_9]KKR93453.1 MAG: hypothetical protein UU44_C0002G0114 [Candidatus Daviesbacteria bacterium GW2011_GWB1_41_15]KKS14998.1 MAG: hypothetical protein UU73_C0003G0197 [Candidatus Daviesbacteria bacterium GW2011_GWA1_41_61]